MKVIIDNKIPFIKGVLEPFIDVEYYPGNEITNDIVKEAGALIVRTRTKCNAALLQESKVKFIATATIGFDHIDTEYCRNNGIHWTNAPGCNAGSVMQYIASALLTYAKDKDIDLREKVLGVIGVGNVGKRIVKLAEYIGMQVLLNDPPRAKAEGPCGFISLNGILREADIITCHVPLIYSGEYKTHHLINSDFLKSLNQSTILINSSRGEVVDSEAIKSALINEKLRDIILDVWENEPTIDIELLKMAYYGTSHIAGYSTDGKANATMMSVRALSRFFNLGIDDWEPDDLPFPDYSLINIDASGKNFQQILTEAILPTYSIKSDDKTLRENPAEFEKHRVNYPLRREFRAYHLSISNLSVENRSTLMRMGFNIKY
jgi:erythronate-4-phosphate dehydrogenase